MAILQGWPQFQASVVFLLRAAAFVSLTPGLQEVPANGSCRFLVSGFFIHGIHSSTLLPYLGEVLQVLGSVRVWINVSRLVGQRYERQEKQTFVEADRLRRSSMSLTIPTHFFYLHSETCLVACMHA